MSIQQIIDRLQGHARLAYLRGDRRQAQAGFSLIEVMIAMVVSAIVLVGVFAFSGVTSATTDQFTRGVKIQQGLESAVATMGNDIRLAGLGFAPMCNELRIQGADNGFTLNPGGGPNPANQVPEVARDGDTDEVYWVLRDGLQAHWRSSPANGGAPIDTQIVFPSQQATSALPMNMADSIDVALGEPGIVASAGAFRLSQGMGSNNGQIAVISGASGGANMLNGSEPMDLNAVRNLFFPGSFFVLMSPSWSVLAEGTNYNDCLLVQVTNEVEGGGNEFKIPTAQTSVFNKDIIGMAGPDLAGAVNEGAIVVPLGRFRWSRYEIDYTVETLPYLVRTELISWVEGDPVVNPSIQYPNCGLNGGSGGSECRIPQLHLPQNTTLAEISDRRAMRVPIAPMIEDMQIAVGCDPIDMSGQTNGTAPITPEKGAREGILTDNVPNRRVDEYVLTDERNIDEWVGNAIEEVEGPDCVFWGSGDDPAGWVGTGNPTDRFADGGWRISPQVVRVTLLGKSETRAGGVISNGLEAGNHYNTLFSIEDRPATAPRLRGREYRTLTETFRPKNITYRDPALP